MDQAALIRHHGRMPPNEDPQQKALRDMQRYAKRGKRLADVQIWIYILFVGIPVLVTCACCGYFLIPYYWHH
jgi:hypothetical protein